MDPCDDVREAQFEAQLEAQLEAHGRLPVGNVALTLMDPIDSRSACELRDSRGSQTSFDSRNVGSIRSVAHGQPPVGFKGFKGFKGFNGFKDMNDLKDA